MQRFKLLSSCRRVYVFTEAESEKEREVEMERIKTVRGKRTEVREDKGEEGREDLRTER